MSRWNFNLLVPAARRYVAVFSIGLAGFAAAPSASATTCPINSISMETGVMACVVANPEWDIRVNDHGYADVATDRRAGFEGREYLSGEWATALSYTSGQTLVTPIWLTPVFEFPTWEYIVDPDTGPNPGTQPTVPGRNTNSDFMLLSPAQQVGTNVDGFGIFQSQIANSHLSVTQTYQMLDTQTGIQQGTSPASAASGSSLASSRYVFHHSFAVSNITTQPIQDLNLHQLLHGLESQTAVYDNRDYNAGFPFRDYRYDITQQGSVLELRDTDVAEPQEQILNTIFDLEGEFLGLPAGALAPLVGSLVNADEQTIRDTLSAEVPFLDQWLAQDPANNGALLDQFVQVILTADALYRHEDTIAFHSIMAPVEWEVGPYGLESAGDCHSTEFVPDGGGGMMEIFCGKPSIGVHLSVEGGSLNGDDGYFPAEFWVAGAQKFALGGLGAAQTVEFDLLLSVRSDTTLVPLPAATWLFGSALALLGWYTRRARRSEA